MKDFIKRLAKNDVISRAFHTAWQVGLVVWAGTEFSLDSAALSAVGGAVLSALKTLVVNQYGHRK